MKTYGCGSHDAKVEQYGTYKQKNFEKRKGEVKQILNNISSSSLTEDDKETLLKELVEEINIVIYQNK